MVALIFRFTHSRYESAHREVQLLRAQLRRQHEDDLEQLVSVKKQLEKKVSYYLFVFRLSLTHLPTSSISTSKVVRRLSVAALLLLLLFMN